VDHLRILKRALHITWKYRALWLVGLLLVLAGGGVMSGGGGGSSGASSGGRGGEGGPWEEDWGDQFRGLDPSEVWRKIVPVVIAVAIIVIAILVLVTVIGVVCVIVRYVTRASLIQMVQSYEETGEEIGFWSGLRLGWSASAFRLFLINLILTLPLALLMILLIGALLALGVLSFTTGRGPTIALGIVLVLLIVPVILLGVAIRVVLGPIIEIAYRTCVIKSLGAWEAIKGGFGLIRRNLGATALQWLLLVGLGIAWRIALIPVNLLLVFLALLVSGLPALLLGGMATLAFAWPVGLVLGLLVFIPAFIVIVSLPNIALTTFATVYHSTAWTLTYRELRVMDAGAQELEWEEIEKEDLDVQG